MGQEREQAIGLTVAVTLRWMGLLAIGLLLAAKGEAVPTLLALLAIGGVYNFVFSINALHGAGSRRQLLIGVGLDVLLALGLFYISRTLLGPLAWVGLMPVVSAAWALGLVGGAGVAVGISILFAALSVVDVSLEQIPTLLIIPATVFLVVGVGLALVLRQFQMLIKPRADLHGEQTERIQGVPSKDFYEIAATLNSSLVVDQVLESALGLGVDSLLEPHETVSRAVGGILLFVEGGLRIAAGRHLPAKDFERVLPGQQGALAELQQVGEPVLQRQPSVDPEFSLVSGLLNCASLYCTPLRAGSDLFGVFFVGHPDANFFTDQRRESIDQVTRQVMVALQNAQLYEALREEKDRIVRIDEQARNQLARHLHDGPSQSIAAIAMRTNLARRLLPKDPAAAGDELHKLEELARRTTKEMRRTLFTLRPQSLETAGLLAALNDLINQIEADEQKKIHVEAEAHVTDQVDTEKQNVLFYIISEALDNALKHAQANGISLRLTKSQRDVVFVEIEDDGQGFTPQEEQIKRVSSGALGLETLRERVKSINGAIYLESLPGRGTHLRVWVPLNEAAAEQLRLGK